jgi:hypothetical protein
MITIPTITQLYNSIVSDLEAQYGTNIPIGGKSVLRTIAIVQAAKLKLFYIAIAKVQKNIFVDTAEPEAKGGTLERFGRVKLGRNPFGATAGQFTVKVTGEIGATLAIGTTFMSDENALNPSIMYILDSDVTLTTEEQNITVRALTAGDAGGLSVGDKIVLTSPIANVDNDAEVMATLIQPLEAEDLEDYRLKTIKSYRLEAQGGSATDYRIWAQDAQGVKEVYPYVRSGYTNEINLYVEATEDDSTDGHGTPSAALLLDVEEVVNVNPDDTLDELERGRRPLQVIVNYLPCETKKVDIVISGAVGFTDEIKANILSSLTDSIKAIRPFVAAADIVRVKNDILDNNKVVAAIIQANPGSIFGAITISVADVTTLTYTFAGGQVPYLNSVTYS